MVPAEWHPVRRTVAHQIQVSDHEPRRLGHWMTRSVPFRFLLIFATASLLVSFAGCSTTPGTGSVAGGSVECESAAGKIPVSGQSFVVTFVGCGGNTGGRSRPFDLTAGSGWLNWVNGDRTKLGNIGFIPGGGHACPSGLSGVKVHGETVTATVVQDDTRSLRVPGKLTMVTCGDSARLFFTNVKFT